MRVYLAGPPNAEKYRTTATSVLSARGHEVVDPMRRDFRGREVGNVSVIVAGDIADLRSVDAVLADFSEHDPGTAMECWYASRDLHLPVYAFHGAARLSPWVTYIAVSVRTSLGLALNDLERRERRTSMSDRMADMQAARDGYNPAR